MYPSDSIGIIEFLVLVYTFLKRNLIIIATTTLIGLAIGLTYVSQKSEYFSTEMVGFSNIIDKTALLEILSPINTLTLEKNYTQLAEVLDITTDQATQIRSIEFSESRHTKTSHAPSITDKKLGEFILVSVNVYDLNVCKNLESGVIQYLAKNPYSKNLYELELKKTNNLINQITTNLAQIDSIGESRDNANIAILTEKNPLNYNEAILTLEDLKIIKQTLKPFTVVSDFYTPKKPANNNELIVIALTVGFFILSLLIVFVRELHLLSKREN